MLKKIKIWAEINEIENKDAVWLGIWAWEQGIVNLS